MNTMANNPQQIISQLTTMCNQMQKTEQQNALELRNLSQNQEDKGINSQLSSLEQKETQAAQQLQQMSQMLSQLSTQMSSPKDNQNR